MKKGSLLILIGWILILCACEKTSAPLPVISPEIYPLKGPTTTTFSFDLSKTLEFDNNDRIFVRWDWEGDGLFDIPFLNEKKLNHRYFKPGTYYPRAQIKNLAGQTSDSSFQIQVSRGFSNPRAAFILTPETGHIYTSFTLDASLTQDDEDSLSSLIFKWDFEGDGIWDTKPGNSPIAFKIYPVPQVYMPRLHVEDPGGRVNIISRVLQVTLLDTCIIPDFITVPGILIQNEDILFDAGKSYYSCDLNENLMYRWDFNNDGFYDTEWSEQATAIHSFPVEQYYFTKLVILNSLGLENSIIKKFWIYHQNQAPSAKFTVSTFGGNTKTVIRFDSWASRDGEDSPSQMLTRWDWENDGIWDSELNFEKEVFHSFASPGKYTVAMELIDRGELRDTAYKEIYISDSQYETDILLDKRGTGWNYYGTIKIRDQWWFSKNLKVDYPHFYGNRAYIGEGSDVGFYGYLYPFEKLPAVCPDGWRVPTKNDWNKLFDTLGPEDHYEELILGGSTGFNAVFGGLIDLDNLPNAEQDLGKRGYYWSSTKPGDQSFMSVWVITIDKNKRKILPGYNPQDQYYSVRCMRDD